MFPLLARGGDCLVGIAQKVDQHLHDPAGVGTNRRRGRLDFGTHRDAPATGRQSLDEQLDRFVQQCLKVDGLELRRAGADCGHQVLQPDLKQVGPAEDRSTHWRFPSSGFRLRRSNSALPRMTESGPRIS